VAAVGVLLSSVFIVRASDAVDAPSVVVQEHIEDAVRSTTDKTESEATVATTMPTEEMLEYLPKTAMFTSEKAAEKLREAFKVALERVRLIPECGGLFTELNADGVEALITTLYTPTHPFDEQTVCTNAAAFTWVGGVHTRLCRRFSSLPVERAAMTLLHEALHHAGLPERPADPDGMSAREIDATVSSACGRKRLERELSARLQH